LPELSSCGTYQTVPSLTEGYAEPALYLQRCERRNNNDAQRKFSLKFALDLWRTELPNGWLGSRIGMKPRCLIEGNASPDNVDSLLRFLYDQGIPSPEIHVIDLIDLAALGRADPRAFYHRANAADLSEVFTNGSIDLLFQDHLLNCAPISHYDAILGEVGRVLSSTGLALVHYTDPSRFPRACGNSLKEWFSVEGTDYRLNMPDFMHQRYLSFPMAERLIETTEGIIMVTLPFGNLEHFTPFEHFEARVANANLKLESRHTMNIIDGEGLDCRRNYCLITPCPR